MPCTKCGGNDHDRSTCTRLGITLTRLLSTTPSPPCEKFACINRERCAAEKLACQSFTRYASDGRTFDPHCTFPERLKSGQKPYRAPEIVATRELFLACDIERSHNQEIATT